MKTTSTRTSTSTFTQARSQRAGFVFGDLATAGDSLYTVKNIGARDTNAIYPSDYPAYLPIASQISNSHKVAANTHQLSQAYQYRLLQISKKLEALLKCPTSFSMAGCLASRC